MRLARNIVSGWAYMIVNTAIVLFMTPFIIRTIGIANFGVWALLLTVITYLNLLDFGSQQAQARFLSRAIGRGDSELFRDVFSNMTIVFAAAGLLIVATVFLLAEYGDAFFNIGDGDGEVFRRILLVMGAAVAIEFTVKSYGGSLAARERLDIINLIEIAGAVVQAIMVFIVLTLDFGLVGMAYGVAGTILIKVIMYVVTAHVSYPHARVSLSRYSPAVLKQLMAYGSISYLITAMDVLRTNIGIPIIAAFLTTTDAAYYSIAAQFVFYFFLLSRSITSAFIPRISRLEGQGDWVELRRQFFLGTRLVGLLVLFVGISMMVFGGKFIELWLGPGFEASYVVLLILTPAAIFTLLHSISTSFLFATSNHGRYARMVVYESIGTVLLGLAFVRSLGVYGMALGMLIPTVLCRMLLQPAMTRRLIDVPWSEYFLRGFAPQLLFGLGYLALAYGVFEVLESQISSMWMFFSVAFGMLLLAGPLAFAVGLTGDERDAVLGRARKWFVRAQQSAS